jgi:F0F1-type ATP synthase assembly protein I
MNKVLGTLPKTFTRKIKQPEHATILVETFFVIEIMVVLKMIQFPSTHSRLVKALSAFLANFVRVCKYCHHDLENKKHDQKALNFEPVR